MEGISEEDVNGESKSVGMKGEKSRSGVQRGKLGKNAKKQKYSRWSAASSNIVGTGTVGGT